MEALVQQAIIALVAQTARHRARQVCTAGLETCLLHPAIAMLVTIAQWVHLAQPNCLAQLDLIVLLDLPFPFHVLLESLVIQRD